MRKIKIVEEKENVVEIEASELVTFEKGDHIETNRGGVALNVSKDNDQKAIYLDSKYDWEIVTIEPSGISATYLIATIKK